MTNFASSPNSSCPLLLKKYFAIQKSALKAWKKVISTYKIGPSIRLLEAT